ncbi:MAG: hypothetical protein IIW20_02750, partial [Clostridia bacterium]|nr:hypothetical protein [Clostridia bacterium]
LPTPAILGLGGGLLFVSVYSLFASLSNKKRAAAILKKLGLSGYGEFISLVDKLTKADEAQKGNNQALALAKKDLIDAKDIYRARIDEFKTALSKLGIEYQDDTDLNDYIDSVSKRLSRFYEEDGELHTESIRLKTAIDQLSSMLSNESENELKEFLTPERRMLAEKVDTSALQRNLSFLSDKQKALVTKEKELRSRYIASKARLESPSQIKERIDEWETKHLALKKQYDAYVLAAEAISGAGDRLRNQLSPTLSREAGESIARVTGGKYEQIGLGASLSLSYTEGGSVRQPESLSGGTRAAFYISLRIALLELLSKERAPLCLDESLVYQDNERAKEILSLLLEKSKEKLQCFLFSCHERESELLKGKNAKIIRI